MGILCLLYLFYKKEQLPAYFKWLRFYFLNWVCIDIIAKILALNSLTNLPLLHLYTLIEFITISLFYRSILNIGKERFQYFNRFILLGVILIIGNTIFIQDIMAHNNLAKSFTNLVAITYSLFFIKDQISGNNETSNNNSDSWINSGFLIYYMGIFLVFLLSDYLLRTNSKLLVDIWTINISLNNFLIIMVLIGTFKFLRNPSLSRN